MDAKEFDALLKKHGTPAIVKERHITSRRYNLVVKKDGEVVETVEYLTMRQARELKSEYLKDGKRCDIIEDVTTDRNGDEIVFHPRNPVPEVMGKCNFLTPTATKMRIERDRNSTRAKAWFRNAQTNKKGGKEIKLAGPSWTDPKSSLYPAYQDAIKRKGYTIKDKETGRVIFIGLMKETTEFLVDLFKTGVTKNDLDILFNGA